LNRGAVQRWILSQNERAAIVRQCEAITDTSRDRQVRKELGHRKIIADEKSVANIVSVIESMHNPFDSHLTELTSISSGVVTSSEVQHDLMSANEIGERSIYEFVDNRLINPSVDFFAPLKALKLKTFSDLGKLKAKTKSGKEIMLRNDKQLFSGLLIIAPNRNIDLREILCYSLSPVSLPLATADGSLAKTTKSALLDAMESSNDDFISTVPYDGALIIDGMGLLHSMRHAVSSFGELADAVLTRLIQLMKKLKCNRVDFVTDTYPAISMKNAERTRRGDGGKQIFCIHNKHQKMPTQWKKFLANGKNKDALVEFLVTEWQGADFGAVRGDISVYIAQGNECHRLDVHDAVLSVQVIDELKCDHEEGDTYLTSLQTCK